MESDGKIPRPKMSGLLQSQIKINVATGVFLAICAGASFRWFVVEARRKRYADFYK